MILEIAERYMGKKNAKAYGERNTAEGVAKLNYCCLMKNKGLVIIGIVLIIISLIFGAYFAPIYTQEGEFRISGLDPDQAVPLIISIVIFFGGVGLLVK